MSLLCHIFFFSVAFDCMLVRLAYLFACVLVCLFVSLLACLLVCLFACLLVCLFACLLVCLFACLLVCIALCEFICTNIRVFYSTAPHHALRFVFVPFPSPPRAEPQQPWQSCSPRVPSEREARDVWRNSQLSVVPPVRTQSVFNGSVSIQNAVIW